MDIKEKITKLEKILSIQLRWINSADTKALMLTPSIIAMMGAMVFLAQNILSWSILAAIASSFAFLFLGSSFLCIIFASFPRVNGPKGSLIYCGGISNNDLGRYLEEVSKLDKASYIKDIASQCHINGEIAHKKFYWVKISFICFYLSVIPWLVSIFALYEGKNLCH